MLEAILTSGGSPLKVYPDSGPGVKTLKYGNETLGYFGEVSKEELFDIIDLRREFNFWDGVDQTRPTWIKMFLDNRVIFFPVRRVVSGFSYTQLYTAGLVYGIDTDGPYPLAPPANQLRIITKAKDAFKVRLFKGGVDLSVNISGATPLSSSVPKLLESEFGRVYSALVAVNIPGYTGPRFQLYGTGDLDTVFTQNTQQSNSASSIYYLKDVANVYPKTSTGALWFPVLELLPFDEVPLLPVNQMVTAGSLAGGLAVGSEPTFVDEVLPIIRQVTTSTFPLEAYGESELVGEYPAQISPPSLRVTVSIPHMVVGQPFTYE